MNQDELVHIIKNAMRQITPSLWKQLAHYDPTTRLRGQLLIAGMIADGMTRLEIMSDAPAPAPFRYPSLGIQGYDRDETNNQPSPNPWATVGEGTKRKVED